MNIAFYILIALIAVALWFLLSFLFPSIGKFLIRIFNDTKENIESTDVTFTKEEERDER